MISTWALWMTTKEGQTLCNLDRTLGFEFVRVANEVGAFSIVMPDDFDDTLLQLDNRVEIWRMFPGVGKLVFTGLVRGWEWATDRDGLTTLTISGDCINALLSRRVVYRGYTT